MGRPDLSAIARSVAALGHERPVTLVDIGAAGGIPPRWRGLQGRLLTIGFEPHRTNFERLEPDSSHIYLNTALLAEEKTVPFYLTSKLQCSSILRPNLETLERFPDQTRWDVVDVEEVRGESLDRALAANGVAGVDFLKLDAEGAELEILSGAAETLARNVVGVEVEVRFAAVHHDQPYFADVDVFLRRADFELIDLRRVYWKRKAYAHTRGRKGQLVVGDALYFRSPGTFPPEGSVTNALAIYALYGYLDIALELVDAAEADGRIDGRIAGAARRLLDQPAGYLVDRVPARARPWLVLLAVRARSLALLALAAVERIAPERVFKRRWLWADGELGNG